MAGENKRPTLATKADGSNKAADTPDTKDTNVAPGTGAAETAAVDTPPADETTPPAVAAVDPAATPAVAAPDAATATVPPVVAQPAFNPPPAPASTPLPTHIDQGVSFDLFVRKMAERGAEFVEKVDVIADHAYKLTLDNGAVVHMIKGVQSVHRFIADHAYSIANGLKLYDRGTGGVVASVPESALKYAKEEIDAGRMSVDYAIKNLANFYKVTEEKAKAALSAFVAPK